MDCYSIMTNIFELILDENSEGVFAISLVDKPATKSNWVAFSELQKMEFKEVEGNRNLLMGAVLIPDLLIDRMGADGKIFQVFLSAETIQKTAYKFMKDSNQNESTLQHKTKVNGVTVVETWLKEHNVNDKSVMQGFDYPLNTWVAVLSVENEDIREKIKSGEIKGLSIEGIFNDKPKNKTTKELLSEHFNNK